MKEVKVGCIIYMAITEEGEKIIESLVGKTPDEARKEVLKLKDWEEHILIQAENDENMNMKIRK